MTKNQKNIGNLDRFFFNQDLALIYQWTQPIAVYLFSPNCRPALKRNRRFYGYFFFVFWFCY